MASDAAACYKQLCSVHLCTLGISFILFYIQVIFIVVHIFTKADSNIASQSALTEVLNQSNLLQRIN